MIDVFVMCDYRMSRFYFLNFELQVRKNIVFKKECSNIKLANTALPKQQFADKLARKTFSLDEKVKFLDFAKGYPTFGCRKIVGIFKIGKTATANIIKEEKNIRNEIALASIKN